MFSRILSLISAIGLTITMLYSWPVLLTKVQADSRGIFILAAIGIIAGFVHGFGVIPKSFFLKVVFSPWIAWPLMCFSGFLIDLYD